MKGYFENMDISKRKELENNLLNFKSLFEQQVDYKDVKNDVVGAYLGDKPVSSIDLSPIKRNDLEPFIECMNPYFFVRILDCSESDDEFAGTIFLSRFKTLSEVALRSLDGGDFKWEEVEFRERADLDGLLHGYTPKEIYDYCVKQGLDHLIK